MASSVRTVGAWSTAPAKAIPSTLAIKTSPSIPSPAQAYEPMVKAVLRHRLVYNIFLQSALYTWAVVSLLTLWQQSISSLGLSSITALPFRPLSLANTGAIWMAVALPSIVARKLLLTSTRSPATSPSKSLYGALSKPSIRRALFTYAISSLLMILFHTLSAYSLNSTDPKLGLFVKSKKHPHYLNGRILFLMMSQLVIAISYAIRTIMLDRFAFKWNLAIQKDEVKSKLSGIEIMKATIVSVVMASSALPVAASIFASARLFLPLLYKMPYFPSLLKPFTAHFLRGSWTILLPLRHADMIHRAWYLGFATSFIWEVSDILFDLNVAKHIAVSHVTSSSNETLVSGISSSDSTFKYFAYSELLTLCEDRSNVGATQRSALFNDQKHTPNLWAHLLRESLLLLGRDYQLFLRRGQPEPPSVIIPPSKPTFPENAVTASPVPLLCKRIYKGAEEADGTALDAALDVVASDGSIRKAMDLGVNAVELPEIFKSTGVKMTPKSAKEEAQKAVESTKGALSIIIKEKINVAIWTVADKHLPIVVKEQLETWAAWWRKERTNKVVEGSLPFRELDIAVVEVISRLTSASLTEDRYGVVQRDIPRILEAFLSFLAAVEEYQIKVNSLYVPPKVDEDLSKKEVQDRETLRYEVEQAGEILGMMADGLKEGVARIVRTFGEKLLAYKFPSRTAQKLQGFLDYC